jgi:hypothetical protein
VICAQCHRRLDGPAHYYDDFANCGIIALCPACHQSVQRARQQARRDADLIDAVFNAALTQSAPE